MIILRTHRLILRELTPADLDDLMEIFSDPIAMKYYPSTKTREEGASWILRNIQRYKEYGIGLWGAVLIEKQELIGQVGLVPQEIDGKPDIEIGYLIKRKYWGQGFATEGAQGCRDYGFQQLRLPKLISIIHPQNAASIRVAEKTGMTLEKQTVKWERNCLIYSMPPTIANSSKM